jgi:hypothetical protein
VLRRLALRRLGPWGTALMVGQGALAAREHWNLLTPAERARLQTLLRTSRGRRRNLTGSERTELRTLTRKLELLALGRRVATGQRRRGR